MAVEGEAKAAGEGLAELASPGFSRGRGTYGLLNSELAPKMAAFVEQHRTVLLAE